MTDGISNSKTAQFIGIGMLTLLLAVGTIFGQAAQQTANSSDQTLRGSGRVNPSTLAMEFDLPLGSYPGRGINVPISLSYSSKVWRMDYVESFPAVNNPSTCHSEHNAVFSEDSASDWTTSLAVPYIEYLGAKALLDGSGHPYSDGGCNSSGVPENPGRYYIKKVVLHLPSGETHELRADDTVRSFPNNANLVGLFEGVFYAVDGSNIKYIENTNAGTYIVQMADGSRYDLASGAVGQTRKAVRFTDRNGNFTTYNESNGTWTDTLGRTLSQPFGLAAPTTPTVLTYTMPGIAGNYKFYWKKLKDTTAAESGLSNFNLNLKYPADNANFALRAAGTYLFQSDTTPVNKRYVSDNGQLFNPIVLTAIELPTGQKYEFRYSVFGIIEDIDYATGGKEIFLHAGNLESLSGANDFFYSQTNSGVIERKVYETAGQGTPYIWTYNVGSVAPNGYKVIINNPDGTIQERFLHRGNAACNGLCPGNNGYDNGLAGYAYEERGYNAAGQIVSKKLTSWTKTATPIPNRNYTMDIHPRVNQAESIIFDASGNGVSATTKYEYEGNLNLRETPVLVNKTLQYAFVPLPGGANNVPPPGEDPDEDPTPVPTPIPPTLLRTQETKYLINDGTIAQAVRDAYKAQNMVGLATTAKVKDAAQIIVSQSEMLYDESGYSPLYRGNPTTSRSWLDTNNSWIETRAKYDTYGNVIEITDAKGNISQIQYTDNFSDGINRNTSAFPTKTISAVPGGNGSGTAFESTVKYDFNTGLAVSTTDANGQTSTIEYNDVMLRPTKSIAPNGHQTISEYGVGTSAATRFVKVKTQIDGTNWKEAISWFDGLGRTYKTQNIDSTGDVFVETQYDSIGRVWRVSNPYRANETLFWTTNVYDEAGRVKEIITPDGAKVQTTFAVATTGANIGTVVTVTDQALKQRRSITNALGQLTRVDEPDTVGSLGAITAPTQPTNYAYDTLSNLTTVTQGSQTRSFVYDSLSRLKSATNPESGLMSYQYDNGGNLTQKTDARNVQTNYGYDNLNRVVSRSYTDGVTPAVSYFYDNLPNAKGKLIKVSSAISTTEYTSFDILGRVLAHKQTTDGNAYTTSYSYNLSGALLEETYPSGRVVKNVLDNDGDLEMVQSKKNANAGFFNYAKNFTYTAAGAVSSMQLGNGKWESTSFNARLQPTQIALGTVQNGTDKLKLNFDYGTTANNGNVLSQQITVPTFSSNPGFTATQAYTYDSLNRLKSAEETTPSQTGWKQTFLYDRFGNRNFDTTNTTTLGSCPQAQCNPTINATNNRFNAGQGYSYDNAGNTTVDAQGRSFTYDGENKQTKVVSNGQTVGEYFYDGDGKRVKKKSYSGGVLTEETIFVYDAGGKLVAEYSNQTSQTPQVSYLTADHLGSPRITTDANGQVLSRRDFMPFGEEITSTYTAQRNINLHYAQDAVRQKFTGYERDIESSLDFAQNRYYGYGHGRFTSPDDFANDTHTSDPQSWNLYVYVRNNPLCLIDPTGEKAKVTVTRKQGENTGTIVISANFGVYADQGNYTPEELQKQADLLKSQIEETFKGGFVLDGVTYTVSASVNVQTFGSETDAVTAGKEGKVDNIVGLRSVNQMDAVGSDGKIVKINGAGFNIAGENFDRMVVATKRNLSGENIYPHEFGHLMGATPTHLSQSLKEGLMKPITSSQRYLTAEDFDLILSKPTRTHNKGVPWGTIAKTTTGGGVKSATAVQGIAYQTTTTQTVRASHTYNKSPVLK